MLKKISSELLWKFINPPFIAVKVMFLGMGLLKYRLLSVLVKLVVLFWCIFSVEYTKCWVNTEILHCYLSETSHYRSSVVSGMSHNRHFYGLYW